MAGAYEKNGDLYIDPVFDTTQGECWSADKYATSHGAWGVDFNFGVVGSANLDSTVYVRAVRSGQRFGSSGDLGYLATSEEVEKFGDWHKIPSYFKEERLMKNFFLATDILKRWVKYPIQTFLLFSLLVGLPSPAPAAETAIIAGDSVNVRSGPGVLHKVIGKVYKDESYLILEEKEGWYRIRLPDGKEGWVYGRQVEVVDPLIAIARQGPLACALFVAKTIEDARYKAFALAQIAGQYAKAGQKDTASKLLSQALEVAKTIKDAWDKASALAQIAGQYAKAGQKDTASELLSQALEVAKTIKYAWGKAFALAQIAGQYAKAGQYDQALEVAKTIEDAWVKAFALAQIADQYAEAGQKDTASELLSQALEVAKTIEYAWDKASLALAQIAGQYAKAGQYDQALEVAKTIEDARYKAFALAQIADQYAKAGQKDTASKLLSQALEVAKTIEDARYKAFALAQIAGQYAKAGQKDTASELLSQALEVAKTIEDAWGKAFALAQIAGQYAKAGQYDQALEVAKTIEDAWDKASALAQIADQYAETGQEVDDKAKEILHEIIKAHAR